MQKNFLIVSSSLNPGSKTLLLGKEAQRAFEKMGIKVNILDLADTPLPICDATACYTDATVIETQEILKKADGILVATPVYNFDTNAGLKNLIELTGAAWEEKVVGILAAAGGNTGYMSTMTFANNLMLDFRCTIIPRFVYATPKDFADGKVVDEEIIERTGGLVKEVVRYVEALR